MTVSSQRKNQSICGCPKIADLYNKPLFTSILYLDQFFNVHMHLISSTPDPKTVCQKVGTFSRFKSFQCCNGLLTHLILYCMSKKSIQKPKDTVLN